MDPSQLLHDHGPTGVILATIFAFLKWLTGGAGVRITVRLADEQMRELGETIGSSAGKVIGDRVDNVEDRAAKNSENVAEIRTTLTALTVLVDERTKRTGVSSIRPKG